MSRFVLLSIIVGFVFTTAHSAQPQSTTQRFDYLVREDMFRGFGGDKVAFDRAMALCEARLGENPDHPEALVWHGTGLLFRSAAAFRRGDTEKAVLLNRSGLAEMTRAVALAPNNLGVRIPRGAVLLAVGMQIADTQRARPYFETAVEDLEKALALEQPRLPTLAEHPKGELLANLAEVWSRLGNAEKSRRYLDRIVAELPDTIYAAAASTRIADPGTNPRITCLGCHTK
jgi:tetratricopeptide (TPR) repeat protein